MNTLMERMVALIMRRMSNEAKDATMESMMEKFFPGQSADDRENLIKEMIRHCLSMMLPHVSTKNALILSNLRPSRVSS